MYLLNVKLSLVFVVKLEVAILREERLFVLLQTDLPALVHDRTEEVVLLVSTANQLVPLTVEDVEEVVSVLTSVLEQLWGEWPRGMWVWFV